MKNTLPRYTIGICVCAALLASCGPTNGNLPFQDNAARVIQTSRRSTQNYKLVYVFKGKPDGAAPYGAMVYLRGEFYGTTTRGGKKDLGTVFKVDDAGNETVIHSFGEPGDGAAPYSGLIAIKGTLYGTTESGGAHGNGTVFSITPSGHEKIVYSFDYNDGRTDGFEPDATPIAYRGALYGTTVYGGTYNYGTVYRVTLAGTETVLHAFGNSDGKYPVGGVVLLHDLLYGTTSQGGSPHCSGGCGTVFNIDASGSEAIVYSFKGINYDDGQYPMGGLTGVNGVLYGTTLEGGRNGLGTVFSMTTSGQETVVHSFGRANDGAYPYDTVIALNGGLYGSTELGGLNGFGTAFELTNLGLDYQYSFGPRSPGTHPYAPLTEAGGVFYGTTSEGGDPGAGTIFRVAF